MHLDLEEIYDMEAYEKERYRTHTHIYLNTHISGALNCLLGSRWIAIALRSRKPFKFLSSLNIDAWKTLSIAQCIYTSSNSIGEGCVCIEACEG